MANAYLTAGGKLLKTGSGPSLFRIPRNFDQLMRDGHTIGWYAYDTSVGIVGDASVYAWGDKLGGINKLAVTSGALMPSYSSSEGIMFDGIDDIISIASLTLNQPFTIYTVLKHISFPTGVNETFFSLNASPTVYIRNSNNGYPEYTIFAGSGLSNYEPSEGKLQIMRTTFNGTSSKLRINNGTITTGNVGTSNANKLDLGGYSNFSQINVKELIVRNVADGSDEGLIYNYLNNKYGIEEPSTLLRDGNTIGWYSYDASVTLNDSSISSWGDKSGRNNILTQSTVAQQPMYSTSEGLIFFNSSNTNIRKEPTIDISIGQPLTVYYVIKQNTRANTRTLLNLATGVYINQSTANNNITTYAGNFLIESSAAIGSWGILRVKFNGTSSKTQWNNNVQHTGNIGTNSMTSIYVGFSVGCADFHCKELIIRNVNESTTNENTIYNYLANKYSL